MATLDRKSFGRIGTADMHYLRLSIATDAASFREGLDRIAAAALNRTGVDTFFARDEHLW